MTRFPVMFWGICSVLVVGAGLAAGQVMEVLRFE